jgi:hypothetical protein
MEKERSYYNDVHSAYSFFYYLFELEPILVGFKSRYDILSRIISARRSSKEERNEYLANKLSEFIRPQVILILHSPDSLLFAKKEELSFSMVCCIFEKDQINYHDHQERYSRTGSTRKNILGNVSGRIPLP